MRRAAKVDANHGDIVRVLRQAGAEVTDLSRVGDGVADLLVSYRGEWFVLEVKDGAKPPSQRKLTPEQKTWHEKQNAKVHIVNHEGEALFAIGAVMDGEDLWRKWL